LRDLAIINATYLYTLANAGERDMLWLAELAADRGYDQILSVAAPLINHAAHTESAEELSRLLADGIEKIKYSVERESQAVFSVLALSSQERNDVMSRDELKLMRGLSDYGNAQTDRLRDAVNQRASQIGVGQQIEPHAEPDPQLAEAAHIVVKRKRFGTVTLDDLSPDGREGYPSGAWDGTVIAALYWCDGHRNLADVIRLTRLELGAEKFDFLGFFKFLERRGYVEFVTLNQ
jgi:hypothetical protein